MPGVLPDVAQAAARTRTLQVALESDEFHVQSPMTARDQAVKTGPASRYGCGAQSYGTNLRSFMPIVQNAVA